MSPAHYFSIFTIANLGQFHTDMANNAVLLWCVHFVHSPFIVVILRPKKHKHSEMNEIKFTDCIFFSCCTKQFASDIRKKCSPIPKWSKIAVWSIVLNILILDFGVVFIQVIIHQSLKKQFVKEKKIVYSTTYWGIVSHWVSGKTNKFRQQPKNVFILCVYFWAKKGKFFQ